MEAMGKKLGKTALVNTMILCFGMKATHLARLGLSFWIVALTVVVDASGQEVELDLRSVFVPVAGESGMPSLRSGGGGGELPPMGLPFVDDFAWPSLAHEEGVVTIKRWESSPVRRTFTLAMDPPTLGCATLDGLDDMGNPYVLNESNPAGYADTLTSRRLLLGNNVPGDSVALSFWYQSGGIANGADAGEDSLIVEFKTSIVDSDPWRWVWSTEGIDDDTTFRSVVIPINATEYFHNGFQIRFRNYGSLEGNVDTWHLDFVRVAEDGGTPAPLFEEVSFVTPPTSMLTYPWTSMPWRHYSLNPAAYLANSVVTHHRSFGDNANSQENIGLKVQRVDVSGLVEAYVPIAGSIPNNSVQGLFETDYVADIELPEVLFDPAVSDSFATFHVSMWEDEVGAANLTSQSGVPDNDSIVHVQVFRDYYAYDDGSAEKAYALDSQGGGGELVVAFDLQDADTLEGLWIHFAPFFDDAVGETYTLKVRGEDGENPGQPGSELVTQFTIHQPDYYAHSYDGFTYVPFESPIPVEGRIYVGFVQQGEERIHIGLDKSTNTNLDYVWFKFPSTTWTPSEIQGSLMIRPVLRAGKNVATSTREVMREVVLPRLFPNPGSGTCSWELLHPATVSIFDLSGRRVAHFPSLQPGRHQWTTSTPGVYMFKGQSTTGERWTQRWIARP